MNLTIGNIYVSSIENMKLTIENMNLTIDNMILTIDSVNLTIENKDNGRVQKIMSL